MSARFSGKRITSALVLVLVFFCALFFGEWVATILVLAACALILHDAAGAFFSAGYKPYTWILYIVLLLMPAAYYFFGGEGAFCLFGLAVVALLCCGVLIKEGSFADVAISAALLAYPLLPASMLLFITMLPNPMLARLMLAITVVIPSACDTFAYFIGILFGKRKLCPAISPKKTVAGALGAFLGGTVGGILIGLVVIYGFQVHSVTLVHFLLLGFLTAFFTQIGDLSASMFKRYCKIKDFAAYIPGHGGILDRLDGVLVTAVLVYVYAQMIILR